MPTRRRQQSQQNKPSKTLLDYSKTSATSTQRTTQQLARHEVGEDVIVGALESLLKTRSHVSKEELEAWAKMRGYPLSTVIKALNNLVSMGKVAKRLNDEGELVYVWRG